MYRYLINREMLKDQKMSPYKAIYETTITGEDLFLFLFIDIFTLLGLFVFGLVYSIHTQSIFPGITPIIIYAILIICLTRFNGGHTIGMLIVGARFLDVQKLKIYTGSEYTSYVWKSFFDRFKYDDLYETYQEYTDYNHQTQSMKKYGLLIVNKKMFNLFKEDYFKNGRVVVPKPLPNSNGIAKITNISTKPIFVEHDEE